MRTRKNSYSKSVSISGSEMQLFNALKNKTLLKDDNRSQLSDSGVKSHSDDFSGMDGVTEFSKSALSMTSHAPVSVAEVEKDGKARLTDVSVKLEASFPSDHCKDDTSMRNSSTAVVFDCKKNSSGKHLYLKKSDAADHPHHNLASKAHSLLSSRPKPVAADRTTSGSLRLPSSLSRQKVPKVIENPPHRRCSLRLQKYQNENTIDEAAVKPDDTDADFSAAKLKRSEDGLHSPVMIDAESLKFAGNAHRAGNKKVVELERWMVRLLSNGRLCLEGYQKSKQGETFHQSDPVAKRLEKNIVQTVSGLVYHLCGKICKSSPTQTGLLKKFLCDFSDGFPPNWKNLLKKASETISLRSSSVDSGLPNSMEKRKPEVALSVKRSLTEKKVKKVAEDNLIKAIIAEKKGSKDAPLNIKDLPVARRSGRLVIPPLAWWASQRVLVDPVSNKTVIAQENDNVLGLLAVHFQPDKDFYSRPIKNIKKETCEQHKPLDKDKQLKEMSSKKTSVVSTKDLRFLDSCGSSSSKAVRISEAGSYKEEFDCDLKSRKKKVSQITRKRDSSCGLSRDLSVSAEEEQSLKVWPFDISSSQSRKRFSCDLPSFPVTCNKKQKKILQACEFEMERNCKRVKRDSSSPQNCCKVLKETDIFADDRQHSYGFKTSDIDVNNLIVPRRLKTASGNDHSNGKIGKAKLVKKASIRCSVREQSEYGRGEEFNAHTHQRCRNEGSHSAHGNSSWRKAGESSMKESKELAYAKSSPVRKTVVRRYDGERGLDERNELSYLAKSLSLTKNFPPKPPVSSNFFLNVNLSDTDDSDDVYYLSFDDEG